MSRIDSLDLRADYIIEAERARHLQERREAALDKMWDWPSVPLFVARRHINVTITADTSQFNRQLSKLNDIYGFSRLVNEYLWGDTVKGGAFHWKPRTRWNLSENWPIYAMAFGLSFLVGLVFGAWPWQ